MSAVEDLARHFEADRHHLRSVAFHLLGSAADADDAVQSAWLKISQADSDAVENLTGWFTTITARVALDQLRTRQRRAEQPLAQAGVLERMRGFTSPAADEEILLTDSVSRALLVVLDRLSPAQRVALRKSPRRPGASPGAHAPVRCCSSTARLVSLWRPVGVCRRCYVSGLAPTAAFTPSTSSGMPTGCVARR